MDMTEVGTRFGIYWSERSVHVVLRRTLKRFWKPGQEKQLSAQSLRICCEGQEVKNAERDIDNGNLACDISEGSKDSSRAIYLLFLN